ncbi:hypothetical protein FO519_004149 [Halicephalobus sp. NKZ332]|nr:hypothetical protein FO519_004149 [Halicephalobus sp. NKZ332]
MAVLDTILLVLLGIVGIQGMASLPDEYVAFLKFQDDFGITYDTQDEMFKRYETFKENLQEIERLNKEHPGTTFGITRFAAHTYEEFGQKLLMDKNYVNKTGTPYISSKAATPKEFDWREKKVVSHIKNQEQCGSCWTFSVIAALESHLAIKTGRHELFSEQQLLDCVTDNYGCTGGYLDTAYRYIGYYGLVHEKKYPYTAEQGSCNLPQDSVQKIQGFYDIVGSEDTIANFVAEKGPASFSIMCPKEMMHYTSGVFDVPDCKGTMLGWHALAIVGYTPDYWIIKNSWGEKWGEKGYIRFKRGKSLCDLDGGAGGPIII